MKYVVTLNSKKYEVEVEESKAVLLSVADAAPAPAAPAAPAAVPAPAAAPAAVSAGSADATKCPMPGTVLDIKKNVGEPVKKGDVILILEAMKMENDIAAPADGTIRAIHVQKGAAVSTGDPLFTIN